MHHSDVSSPYYQCYQSNFQNPNLTSNPTDPQFNINPSPSPVTTAYASAPPVSYSDHSNYSSPYPPYPQNPDHVPNPPPTYMPNVNNSQSSAPSHQTYSFPHLMPQPPASYAYDQNSTSLNYDHSGVNNRSYYTNPSYSSAPYDAYNFPNYENGQDFRGYGSQGMYRGFGDDSAGGDVYKYSGGKVEPYDDRGSLSVSAGSVLFDDYGRPINISNGKRQNGSGSLPKIVKAIPKADGQEDVKNGVQKFRLKLLSEGIGQSDMDVLCQIGLDGIRILDPSSSRMLKIYPLETVTRCEVLDSYIFAFWSKSSVDIEPRRIRLKSNSYTTNNILDTVTAATFQLKEMGESNKPYDPPKGSEQASEKKKGFADWMNMMKPSNEEKDHWVPDEAVKKCTACGTDFGTFVRRHHCRNCGDIFCEKCTQGRTVLTADEYAQPVRVCDHCMAEVTQRLSKTKETAGKVSGLQSHEDLAKKLQVVMNKNSTTSTGSKSDGYGLRMKEVECPTCTVHLQVQVPASGSETIECSVCQHPFLVRAH